MIEPMTRIGACIGYGLMLTAVSLSAACSRQTVEKTYAWSKPVAATAVIRTRTAGGNGKYTPDRRTVVSEIVFTYDSHTVTVPGSKVGVEDLNHNTQEYDFYVALFQSEDVLALRLLGSDGGFSHASVLVFQQGKLVHSETMWLEDYSALLSRGDKDSDLDINEGRGLAPWLAKYRS